MPRRFIVDYPRDELKKNVKLLRNAKSNYPYSIIHVLRNYEQDVNKEDHLGNFLSFINFFEITIQYCSCIMISLLRFRKVQFDEELKQVASKVVGKTLSMGDWVNDIFLVLLKKSYTILEDEPFIKSMHETLLAKKGNILQGWPSRKGDEFQSIVYFRNKYVGHGTKLASEKYEALLELLEPRLFVFLEAISPLAGYTTFSLSEIVDDLSEPGEYLINKLTGSELDEAIEITSEEPILENSYYLIFRKLEDLDDVIEGEIMHITPFVIYQPVEAEKLEGEKTTLVFQSIKAENLKRLQYISPHPHVEPRQTEFFKDKFKAFLEEVLGKSVVGKNYRIELIKGKTWEEYKERLHSETTKFLGQMKAEKYDPFLYVERKEIRTIWDQFRLMDNKRAFILLGNAGSGKTNLICKLSEDLIAEGHAIIAFNSSIFSSISLETKFLKIFGEKGIKQSLEKLNSFALKENKKVYLLFDALNECLHYGKDSDANGAVELLKEINDIFIEDYLTQIKVLITCRTYTWEEVIQSKRELLNLPLYLTSDDLTEIAADSNISLKGFSEDEFLEAYPKYQQKFGIKTPLNVLNDAAYAFTRNKLSDPLILKIACQVFTEDNLPHSLHQLESVHLFESLLETVRGQDDGEDQIYILEEFTRSMRNRRTDAISLKTLFTSFKRESSELHSFSKELFDGKISKWSAPALRLLDKGILRIDRTYEPPELRFTYERFHEYMYALVFHQDESEKVARGIPIPAKAYEQELLDMNAYAVTDGALRHALIMDYHRNGRDTSTFVSLANSKVYRAASLVMNTLNSLILDNYEEVCKLISKFLIYNAETVLPIAEEMEKKEALLEKGKKGKEKMSVEDLEIINSEVNELNLQLHPVLQVRKIAMQVIYEIFKSPIFKNNLYQGKHSPFELLWQAMGDPIAKVRDNVSLYIYYISKYDVEISIHVLNHLSSKIMDTPLLSLARGSKRKEFQQSYIEPAGRLSLLLTIDSLIEKGDYGMSTKVKATWREILKKLTLKFSLIKIVMPFLKFFLRRQATVQVEYVNNGIEYQHFWESIPKSGPETEWNIETFEKLIPFLNPDKAGIEAYHKPILEGIKTGDAFSYFLIERVLVSQGWKDWNRIKPLTIAVVEMPEDAPWIDYMQMSMLYVLFHSIEKSDHLEDEAFDQFAQLSESWSARCKGLFYAHNNQQANKGKPYKQYPLNWYGAAYCKHFGDGIARTGDPYPLPVFRNLINKAFENEDRELLYYCLENIITLVTDFSKPKSAIQLFDYVISLFKHESQIRNFDQQQTDRDEHQKDLRSFLCGLMGTIKSYYPVEVTEYLQHGLVHSDFPDIERFREDLNNYNQSHESIGDLLTHKFGNFIIWGLLNDKDVSQFFMAGFKIGSDVNDYFSWFDGIVRLSFKKLFNINV